MKKTLLAAWIAGGSVVVLGIYAYVQNGTVPNVSDLWDALTSLFQRANAIVSGTVSDTIGTGTYLDSATSLVARIESFRSHSYPDAGGYSIGYGHHLRAGDGFSADSVISQSDAWALLQDDIATTDECIGSNVQVALTDGQRAALISFVYNVGCGAFANSTMLRLINQGDFQGASDQFGAWIYSTSNGVKSINSALVARRQTEQGVFNS